ncbi:aminotransferase class I/II-fold pyridoxal phosphate-dependent enzyme [Candidatus Bathyarchaeota archaeon]|nr:aminotransferase class I/II-fold pyridoxal phosphate-dependent enzyme [Candidatus Bathyarchaeota archaeon]
MRNPTSFLKKEFEDLVENSLDWKMKQVEGPNQPDSIVDSKKVILLCSNNYLGLSYHAKVKKAAIDAIEKYGAGAGAVRVISGTMDIHVELEKRLASFKNAEASLTFPTGFSVNSGLIPQLVGDEDIIISDELNHGSIIDGVRLSKAERIVYKHNDIEDLSSVISKIDKKSPPYRRILIITDGVFSMDGDIAKLDEIYKVSKDVGAMIYVDDAHGEGVLGEKGKGIVNHFKLDHNKIHVEMGTFSKAFGTVGGHISGSKELINFSWNKCRTLLLSSAPPPSVAASTIAAIDVLEHEPEHVKKLWDNTIYFKRTVKDLGFNTGISETPIIPIIVNESHKAQNFASQLYENGIYVVPIVYPMVAKDKARIRIQINSELTNEHLDYVISKLESLGKKLKII